MPAKLTQEEVIEQIKIKTGNRINFSKFVYICNLTPAIFGCNICGHWWPTPPKTLKKSGKCPECLKKETGNRGRKKREKLIQEFRAIHSDFYNYDKFVYISAHKKSIITCPIHGDFPQSASMHRKNQGCKKCGYIKVATNQTLTEEEVLKRFKSLYLYIQKVRWIFKSR